MKAEIQKELKLMASIFKIGVVGFGGGTALIPVIEREVVEDQKIVEKSEYDKDVLYRSRLLQVLESVHMELRVWQLLHSLWLFRVCL